MKILLVNKYHYHKGGAETFYLGLGELLKNEGHEVLYFSMNDENNLPSNESQYFVSNVDYSGKDSVFKQIKYGFKIVYNREAKKKFKKLIDDKKPDLIVLNNIHRQIGLSILSAIKKRKIPTLWVVHDLISICPNCVMLCNDVICEKCSKGKYINCLKNKCIKNSFIKSALGTIEAYYAKITHKYDVPSMYICPSIFFKNKLEESRVTKKPIRFLRNFAPLDLEIKDAKKYKKNLIFIGRISKEKGVLNLIKAFNLLKADFTLTIVGDGPQFNEALNLIDSLKEERVLLVGRKNKKEIYDLLDESYASIVSSIWYENCPYSIIESFSRGVPVLGSNLGGIPEMVIENETGFLFKNSSLESLLIALNKICNMNKEDYLKMRSNCIKFVEDNCNPKKYVKSIETMFHEID